MHAAQPSATIYLASDNALLAHDTALQLRQAGYAVQLFPHIAALAAAAEKSVPAAVLVDMAVPDDAALAACRDRCGRPFPIIWIAPRDSFDARLASARAGADACFVRPLDAAALFERLAQLINVRAAPPRVLVLASEPRTARMIMETLRPAGIDVHLLERVPALFAALGDLRPEVVLLDIDLPQCRGEEVARLIRQNPAWLDLPLIVAGSAGPLPGIDAALPRPLQPALLPPLIGALAQRYRTLRGLILRDSLTGLYNHAALEELLGRELQRGARERTPVALAMIDIDFFKRVNDTYGHPVGDQVIRALSRLLQERLRRGDVVGRYGGEEFGVILPGTDAQAAVAVLNEVRLCFGALRHHGGETEFSVTFSAGVADSRSHTDPAALFAAADAALYAAKHGGRNCIRSE